MNEPQKLRKKRAFTPENARRARKQGYEDALHFAKSIGLNEDYKNDLKAKKDVIDPSGDSHSVKGGQKKWQIFLYGLRRFEEDFRAMNGIGELLINCIKAFPKSFDEYQKNKAEAKEKLRPHMIELADKLRNKHRLKVFINKSMFNGGEVNYLTAFDNNKFHVFWGKEIARVMTENLVVLNSQARQVGQFSEQKVIFKYEKTTLGEIEVRRDSKSHYKEILFSILKPKIMKLLYSKITFKQNYNDAVIVYGEATKHFGRWKKVN
jgi:hypothetical protein